MINIFLFYSLVVSFLPVPSQDVVKSDSLTLLFMGDIMGHDSQIIASYDSTSNTYNFNNVFRKVNPIIKSADFAIANLEVTLSGPPYKGYPKFSSPDELAVACKQNGMEILVTANNHANDLGTKGIIRTLNTLDSLAIMHTGTFRDSVERDTTNLLILKKNSIKLGLLNYTYGTNRKVSDYPAIVNKIDTVAMLADVKLSKYDSLDKLIVVLHWGKEYQSQPNKKQIKLTEFLFNNGVDIIIGSHPHVLQPMEYYAKTDSTKERFIAYSLGNFVSNQRNRKNDGGAMVQLKITKTEDETNITNQGYYLTWVNKTTTDSKTSFEVISCTDYDENKKILLDSVSDLAIKTYTEDSRKLFKNRNQNVEELPFPFIEKELEAQ